MIVKFIHEGAAVVRFRWHYLLGKTAARRRHRLSGKPEEVGSLATPAHAKKKYTSGGCLFTNRLTPGQRDKLMRASSWVLSPELD
ncbi:hypothetical protein [Pantoea stewartii]|uniref:hypothetical protein n=1 Tax=Pantoea stewartii TaxID=66269 RepID=UPI00363D1E84